MCIRDRCYAALESILALFNPLLKAIGHERLDKPFAAVEGAVKGFLFDSQSCGQCTLGETGMACPMNCPKTLRNGPCGGVRQNGGCEIKPEMTCVWVNAWEGSQKIGVRKNITRMIAETRWPKSRKRVQITPSSIITQAALTR